MKVKRIIFKSKDDSWGMTDCAEAKQEFSWHGTGECMGG